MSAARSRRPIRFGLILLTTIGTGVLAVPAAAQAAATGVATSIGRTVTYKAASGRANRVVIIPITRAVIVDDAFPIKAGKGCTAIRKDRTRVRCTIPATGQPVLAVHTYDRNDTVVNRTRFALHAQGGVGNDTLTGGPGADVLAGDGGADTFYAGAGKDDVTGGPGNDTVHTGPGDDGVLGNDGNDKIYTGAGDDRVGGWFGHDYIDLGAGNDTAWGFVGHDVIHGSSGNDDIQGNGGEDKLFGGAGDDVLDGDDGYGNPIGDRDVLDGGPDQDRCPSWGADLLKSCESPW